MKEFLTGIVRIQRGRKRSRLVVVEGDKRVEVAPRQGMAVYPGDRVKVEIRMPVWARRRRHGMSIREASIVTVLERGSRHLMGRYRSSRQHAWVVPKDADVIEPVQVDVRPDIPDNSVVAVELDSVPGTARGSIAKVWTEPDTGRAMIEQIIYERDLPREFPRAALDEAGSFPAKLDRGEVAARRDLRDLAVIVIDPEGAKDHDDGVSWEPDREGGGRLGVHIADVSHYVRPGSALDREARARGVSVYLPDRVLPMLPPRLSADLCSLIEGKDRLARTVFIDFDADGNFKEGEMTASVIRPSANMTYEEVMEILRDPGSRRRHAGVLKAMNKLAGRLRKERFGRGSLDFDFPEVEIGMDDTGEPEKMLQRRGDESHYLIEEFMIAANRFTGRALDRRGLGIWRVHEPPSPDKVQELEEFLSGLGVKLRRGARAQDMRSADFQALLDRFKGKPEEYAVHRRILMAMSLAIYSETNAGHFGLALKTYAHFTSPIRRYADLIVHRLTGAEKGAGMKTRQLAEIAATTSALERRSERAERSIKRRMILRYLGRRPGEVFPGTVSRLEGFGAFVELNGLEIDGLVPAEERFQISRNGMSMRGRRSGETITIGEQVRVRVARVDMNLERLDLILE